MKKTIIFVIALLLVSFTCSVAFADAFTSDFQAGFRVEGKMGHLEYDETKGYSFKVLGGSLVGSYVVNTFLGDLGVTGTLGVAVAGDSTLDGESFNHGGWFTRSNCYDYSSRLGLRYGFSFDDISLYAEAHAAWDSVVFQEGSTQEWERLSFHTLGLGFGGGISKYINEGLTISLSAFYDMGIKSFTAARTRSNWDTSDAVTKDIDATSGMINIAFGVTAGF